MNHTTENIKTAMRMRNYLIKAFNDLDVRPLKTNGGAYGPFDKRQELDAVILGDTEQVVDRKRELILDVLDEQNQYLDNEVEVMITKPMRGDTDNADWFAIIRVFGPKAQKNPVEEF